MTTDGELIDGMRRGVDGAVREFLARFGPVLRGYARRMRLDGRDAETVIADVMEDAVMRLIELPRSRRPRSVPTYLAVAFRNRVVDRAREEAVALAAYETDCPEDRPRGCSEGTERAAKGEGEGEGEGESHDSGSASVALASLARALDDALSAEERRVLAWISEAIPQAEIARWLKVSPAVLRKRVERLRAKLRVQAAAYEGTIDGEARAELHRFFMRCEGRQSSEHGRKSVASGIVAREVNADE